MNIYFDTEFSALDDTAELISLGAVANSGEELYVEMPVPANCSAFVQQEVLPHLENQHTLQSAADLEQRLATWLAQFPEPRMLLADSTWDFYVLRKALTGQGTHKIGQLTASGPLASVLVLTVPPLGDDALAVFEAARAESYAVHSRLHHALDDARALRAGVVAIQRQQW